MNVDLLRKVATHILEEPKRLHMHSFVRRQDRGDSLTSRKGEIREFPECGSAGCIAGWAIMLTSNEPLPWDVGIIMRQARRLLELSDDESYRLFGPADWPVKFYKGLTDDGSPEAAQATADRIEHFIETGGKE